MFEPHDFALFLLASAALIAAPGPDMLLVIARSLSGGARDGILATAGLVGGVLVHTCAVAFGLAALFAASALAFALVKWIGAAYLVWLGIQALRDAREAPELRADARRLRRADDRARAAACAGGEVSVLSGIEMAVGFNRP